MESDAREKKCYSLVVDKKGRGVKSWKSRDAGAFLPASSGSPHLLELKDIVGCSLKSIATVKNQCGGTLNH